MSYMKEVEVFYWEALNKDELIDSTSAKKFEQAMILLDQERNQAEQQIQQSEELKQLFGFIQPFMCLFSITEFTSEDSSSDEEEVQHQYKNLGDSSSKEEDFIHNLRPETQIPKQEQTYGSGTKNDDIPFTPTRQGIKGKVTSTILPVN